MGLEAEATEDDLEDDRDRPASPTEGVVVRSVLGLGAADMVTPLCGDGFYPSCMIKRLSYCTYMSPICTHVASFSNDNIAL